MKTEVLHIRAYSQAVGTVSIKLRRGKHTTRTVRLLETGRGGVLADTPGFNLPSLDGVTMEALPESFPEITARLEDNRCALLRTASPGSALFCPLQRHVPTDSQLPRKTRSLAHGSITL